MSGSSAVTTGPVAPEHATSRHLVELRDVGKTYGSVEALSGVSMVVDAGNVTCVLGDNGAGKSTLIKIIAGLHQHDSGELLIDGAPTRLTSPRQALDRGIATVYQDLAVVSLMPVWRNFFLGSELTGPLGAMRTTEMKGITKQSMLEMGIDLRDVEQAIGTLSGGERQCVAIARAVHFGARVLILDEPTAALGVKQSGIVLRNILRARDQGLGVVLITHNPNHAYPVGDRFLVLKRGGAIANAEKRDITLHELTSLMAGGAELEELAQELEQTGGHSDIIDAIDRVETAIETPPDASR